MPSHCRTRVKDIRDFIKVGDEVTVKILSIDEKTKRASLSMRAVKAVPSVKKEKRQAELKTMPEISAGFYTLKEKLREWIEQSKHE